MLAQNAYQATSVGKTGTLSYGGMVSVGGSGDPSAGYEKFQAEVEELEALEARGLVKITFRHRESQTAKRYLDLVKFERLM